MATGPPVPDHPGLRDDPAAQASIAREKGHAALASGDTAEAIRWFDRALRLAPLDPNLALSLAALLLGRDTARAAALFDRVAAESGVREAWQGLAAARLMLGDAGEAASCLAKALSQATVVTSPDPLADEIAGRTGAAGWCGIAPDGTLSARVFDHGPLRVLLDGRPLHTTLLPAGWMRARTLEASCGNRPLIGSPIDLRAVNRVVGAVEADADGIRGWAWQPGNPDVHPTLLVRPAAGGRGFQLVADDETVTIADAGPLARPRGFFIPATRLAGFTGIWRVIAADNRDLLGSPLQPSPPPLAGGGRGEGNRLAEHQETWSPAGRDPREGTQPKHPTQAPRPRRAAAPPAASHFPRSTPPPPTTPAAQPTRPVGPRSTRRRPVAIVIPVHNGADVTLSCLQSVLASRLRGTWVVVVDDASDQPALVSALDRLAASRRIRLIRNPRNLGFPGSANAGILACPDRDVVLLNSDTLVPPAWLERLRNVAYGAPAIGSVTPFSNDATIVSYPDREGGNPIPDQAVTDRLAALAWKANGESAVDIPVGVGFCLYIRRDCLDEVGLLRADVFAQGYGEENDFCLRARALGWRNVAAPGVFVAHLGGASFGGAGSHLRRRNQRLLNLLHPGYNQLIDAFVRSDTLADPRRRLDLARWRADRRGRPAALLITHAHGGGVEQRIQQACAVHRAAGRRPLVLRPIAGNVRGATLSDGADDRFPNLRFVLPKELRALVRLLRAGNVAGIEVHHLLDHDPSIYRLIAELGRPYDVHVHDYAWFCPRISLVGADERYCGEPEAAGCERCIAQAGRFDGEDIPVTALLDRSAGFLSAARRVIAPSADTARRMRRHFPALRPEVVPHGNDAAIARPPMPSERHDAQKPDRHRVCVAGAIGLHKGFYVLLACAEDAARRNLPLEFVVVGTTIDDPKLLATERVFVTGRFRREEAVSLIRNQQASLGFVPSIWPETWCLALSELWQAGLTVAAFDMGAPAERIRRTRRGFLLAPGLSPAAVNDALLRTVELSPDCLHATTSLPLRQLA